MAYPVAALLRPVSGRNGRSYDPAPALLRPGRNLRNHWGAVGTAIFRIPFNIYKNCSDRERFINLNAASRRKNRFAHLEQRRSRGVMVPRLVGRSSLRSLLPPAPVFPYLAAVRYVKGE
jgi:hypothetical protein